MKCEFCEKPATIHLTRIINQKTRKFHLCDECAREHNLVADAQQELNVPALLQFLLSHSQASRGKKDADSVVCPGCGIKYAQFRAQGRLGCPNDYELFRAALEPLLERIHRRLRHVGKAPAQFQARQREAELQRLRDELASAVRDERFEEAARVRDLIRSMGTPE